MISQLRRTAQSLRHHPRLRKFTPLWNWLRLPYLLVLRTFGSRNGIAVTIAGQSVRLHPNFATQKWESVEEASYRVFASLLRQDSVVFDVGAHIGTYTLLAAGVVRPPGRIVAYEPHVTTRAYLLRHLAYNGANDRVTVREVGCGAEAGRALFYSLPDSAEGTFGVVPQTGLNQTEIEITTIDKESAQFGYVPSLIKIDVEGAEWSVLRGAVNTLRSAKPVLLLSLHPTALAQQSIKLEEILGWLTEQAYDWREIGRDHEVHIVAHPIQPALT